MGLVSFLTVRVVELAVVVLLIVFMPSLPPNANFTYNKVTPPLSLEGKLALNNRLNGVEHLHENELKGPEAFAEYNGELYTSLYNGDVVKLSKGHIVPVVKFGKPCLSHVEESICGRPLGLQFNQNGDLIVADAYYGIWKVDVKTGQKTLLVSMDKEIEGKKPMLPNSVALASNGDIYWTDSTTEFKLEDGLYTLLADGSGRLLHYNAKTKTSKVLIDGLQFANGVILSDNEDFLLISETAQSRILRYYLKGNKKGTYDIFIDGLPGLPDNLNSDGKGGFFVPLVFARDADHPAVSQIFQPFPLVRKLVARILGLTELGFQTIEKMYPNIYSKSAIHWIGHFESITVLNPKRCTILRLSPSGEIIESLHSGDHSVVGISDVHIFGDDLYLGSPFNNYIGRIKLSEAGLEHLARKKREVPVKQAPPPVQQKQTPPPVKQAPPPTPAPKQTPPPTAAPVKQTPPPPTAAPVKQAPPPTQAPPKVKPAAAKQSPPPTPSPVKQAPPAAKQTPPPPAAKQTPPPASKQAPPPAPTPAKQAPPPAPTPAKQASPPVIKPSQPTPTKKESEKEIPKVVPVKENSVPKPRK